MTTYNTITAAEVAPLAPITSSLGQRWRDNPIAMGEGASTAPLIYAGWHPYNKATVGDSNDGLLYDHAVTGAVGSFETPDFEDGFEYAIVIDGLSSNNVPDFQIELYRATDAAYSVATSGTITNATFKLYGIARIVYPRVQSIYHSIIWESPLVQDDGLGTAIISANGGVFDATIQKISKARVSLSSNQFDAGKAYLLRRREYMTG
jgi:hypothetical protein